MNETERLQLQKLLDVNEAEDNTHMIRAFKHSDRIKEDVRQLLDLKKNYQRLSKTNPVEFDKMCVSRCTFLFNNYTDIYNKVKKDELNIQILSKFLLVLKNIEDGKVDQHEASVTIGKVLKEMYVDSALRKSEHIEEAAAAKKKGKKVDKKLPPRKVTWKEYAAMQAAKSNA